MAFTQVESAGISSSLSIQSVAVSGVITATSGFVGNLTGNVTGSLSLSSGVVINSPISNTIAFNIDNAEIGRFNNSGNFGLGIQNASTKLEVNGGIKASINNLPGGTTSFVVTRLDGSSSSLAAPSAVYLQQVCGITTNGSYWINLPTVGPTQVYCILDPSCAGGGWMMAMKATTGTVFSYSSSYWTSNNVLNSIDLTRNNADAKYNTYNYYQARDWLAIWPDIGNGGDISGGYGGWTWVENGATGNTESILTFMNRSVQVTKASNGVSYSATNPAPTGLPKYGNNWSMESGFQWYGLNYQANSSSRVRWGWATNNENDQASNDISGGIGMDTNYGSFSAGDRVNCCASISGINRSARVEWYVR